MLTAKMISLKFVKIHHRCEKLSVISFNVQKNRNFKGTKRLDRTDWNWTILTAAFCHSLIFPCCSVCQLTGQSSQPRSSSAQVNRFTLLILSNKHYISKEPAKHTRLCAGFDVCNFHKKRKIQNCYRSGSNPYMCEEPFFSFMTT